MDGIETHDKQQGREMGWHGKTDVKPELAIGNCWLKDWDYVPRKLQMDGKDLPFAALGVTDVPDLIVGEPYTPKTFKPITNAKLLELLDKAIGDKDMPLASCGTIQSRGKQFLSFETGAIYTAGGREFKAYFNVGNGNDKSCPLWQNISRTCTVCFNTFTQNLLGGGLIMEVKKTQFSEFKLADFGKAAKAMLAGEREFQAQFESLALTPVTLDDARAFFAGFLSIGKNKDEMSTRAENTVERLLQLFRGGAGNNGENWADAFSAITDFYSHESAGENVWKNFVSSEFGAALSKKQFAWAVVCVENSRNATIAAGRKLLEANK